MNKIFLMLFMLICNGIYFNSLIASTHKNNSQLYTLAQLKAEFTIPNRATIKKINDIDSIKSLNEMLISQYDKVDNLLKSNYDIPERYQTGLYKNELLCTTLILVQRLLELEEQENKDSQKK